MTFEEALEYVRRQVDLAANEYGESPKDGEALDALRAVKLQHDQAMATLGAKYEHLLSTATALGAFAENHAKFVRAWGSVRRYLRDVEVNAHVALPREVVLTLGEHNWKLTMYQVIPDELDKVKLYEETLTDYQDAPCPRLLAEWCEEQMRPVHYGRPR